MREELEKQLVKDFPHTFYREDRNKGGVPMDFFGIEVGNGWHSLLRKTAEKLEPLFKAAIEKDPEGYGFGYYRTSQIKEKYGTGRWYLSGGTDEMWNIVSDWEHQTQTICEQCGNPGKLRGNLWLYTSCNDCSKPEDRDGLEIVERAYLEKEKSNGKI